MKIGFTCGAWDLLHAGHLHFLRESRLKCDRLIVGLHTDPKIDRKSKNRPVQSTYERWVQLKGCSYVDDIVPYDTENDLTNLLATLDIDLRFLGTDYIAKYYTGKELCDKRGIDIIYIDRLHNYSSSELRKRVCDAESGIL